MVMVILMVLLMIERGGMKYLFSCYYYVKIHRLLNVLYLIRKPLGDEGNDFDELKKSKMVIILSS